MISPTNAEDEKTSIASTGKFDDLVEQLSARVHSGEALDAQMILAEHPEHAEQLRHLLPAIEMLAMLKDEPSSSSSRAAKQGNVDSIGLLGDYRIIRQIGRGGMGVVYEAEQLSMNRRVALKVLPFAAVMDQRQLARFKNEAQAAGQLQHQNIVQVYAVGHERGVHFYAMQYIEGRTLSKVIGELRQVSGLQRLNANSSGRRRTEGDEGSSSQGTQKPRGGVPATPISGAIVNEQVTPEGANKVGGHGVEQGSGGQEEGETTGQPDRARPAAPYLREAGKGPAKRTGEARVPDLARSAGAGSAPQIGIEKRAIRALSTETSTKSEHFFRTIAQLGMQAAEALDHAHKHGVLHRDVKPANLILDACGNLWVTDFGLARITSSPYEAGDGGGQGGGNLTMTGDLIGTLRYMSPEQALAKRTVVDHRTDVYSLGVTLYELLTLHPAYSGRDRQELLKQLAFTEPKAPRRLNPAIPGELETITLKAMAKNPVERYDTAAALAEDLRRYLEDKPIRARRPSLLHGAGKWCRRHKPAVASALVLLLLALVVLGTSTLLIWQAQQRTSIALATANRNYREAERQREAARLAEQQAHAHAQVAERERAIAVENEQIAKSNELLARRRFYAAQMNLAQQAWAADNPARVLELLETQRPRFDEADLRSFEWYYLWRLSQPGHVYTLRSPRTPRYRIGHCVAFSPDSKTLYTRASGAPIRLWDVATGKLQTSLRGRETGWRSIALSPDGHVLAEVGGPTGNEVALWNVDTGQCEVTIATGAVVHLAFSHDGKTLAVCGGDTGIPHVLQLWDVTTRRKLADLKGRWANGFTFSRDDKLLATGEALWDLTATPPRICRRFPADVRSVALSPDGEILATGGDDGVKLWNVADGKSTSEFPRREGRRPVVCVEFSPDGQTLAFATADRVATLWNHTSGLVRNYVHRGQVVSVAYSPDGKLLASASDDGTVKLWDLSVAEPTTLPEARGAVSGLFSPDGKTLALQGPEEHVRLLDVATGQVRATLQGIQGKHPLAFAGNSNLVATLSSTVGVKLWDATTGEESARFRGSTKPDWCVALSPDGKILASGAYDDEEEFVRLWDVESRQVRALARFPNDQNAYALAFSPDGKTLAAGLQFGIVALFDPATGRELRRLQGRTAAWDWARCVAYSADGRMVAAGSGPGSLTVWDADSGELRASLRGHASVITSVEFFPDGETLVSRSEDGNLKFWDVATAQEKLTWNGCSFVAVSPDGKTLAMGRANGGTVHLWRAATGKEASAYRTERDPLEPDSPVGHNNAGDRFWAAGRHTEAEQAYRRALARLEQLTVRFPNVPYYREELARSWFSLSLLHRAGGAAEEAGQARQRGLDVFTRLLGEFPEVPECARGVVTSHFTLAELLDQENRAAEADLAGKQGRDLEQILAKAQSYAPSRN